MGQILTAVLELHRPSRRKQAILFSATEKYTTYFWQKIAESEETARRLIDVDDARERKKAIWALGRAARLALPSSLIPTSLADGIQSELEQHVTAFVGSARAGLNPSYPKPDEGAEHDYEQALNDLSTATDEEDIDAASAALLRSAPRHAFRNMRILRRQFIRILKSEKSVVASIALLSGNDPDVVASRRRCHTKEGKCLSDNTKHKALTSRSFVNFPLSFSKRDKYLFLNSKAVLKSGTIVFRPNPGAEQGTREGRWFLYAAFEIPAEQRPVTGAVIGVDRGIVKPLVATVVDKQGAVVNSVGDFKSDRIGKLIEQYETRRRAQQMRTGRSSAVYANQMNDLLHRVANEIVDLAKKHGARVAFEKLSGLKKVVVTPRPKGARKGGYRKALKKAQLSRLEFMVDYKLKLAGLPSIREVPAAGTSITCAACGHVDKANRSTQAMFQCTACGHIDNADQNASIIIARRGLMEPKKGDKLNDLHREMLRNMVPGQAASAAPPLAASSATVAVRNPSPSGASPAPSSRPSRRPEARISSRAKASGTSARSLRRRRPPAQTAP